MKKLIVISRFAHSLEWLSDIKIPYIIYNKGEDDLKFSNIRIPNRGREGETYLRYIIENYNNLPDIIIFCQDWPFDHYNNFINEIHSTSFSENIIGLSDHVYTCNSEGYPQHPNLHIGRVYEKIFNTQKSSFTFYAGAQFIVPKKFILNKSLETWKRLYEIYGESESNPWIFERLWPSIWEYSEISNINISLLIGLKNNLDYTKNFYNTTRKLYPNVELCFASYGSTDGTHEWLESLNDENIKYFHSNESKTFSDTFNKAASLATKDYVMFLHNDIVIAPNFLENVEKHLSPDSIISYTTIEPPIFAGHERPGKIIKDFGTDINTFQIDDMYTFSDIQREIYRDKTEQGITFFMCMPKDKYLEIGGLHNIFNPMFCEDDDLILRWKLLGMNLFTSLDAICYHFVSKTSRFSKDYQTRTQQIEQHSNKNFVRKWGFRNSVHNKKYNTAFIIHDCNLQILELLEPWCDRIYVSNDNIINEYINSEQPNTSFDLTKRVLNINKNEPYAENDIMIEFNAQHFNQNSFNIIQNLSDIITESGEIGEFELDCLKITIRDLKTYEHELIYL